MEKNDRYGIKIAIIYCLVWFVDLLDASTLNVSLASIAESFHIDPIHAEWTIVGFLLTMTLGISISGWLGDRFGTRPIFLISQVLYLVSSIGCAYSTNIDSLIIFRGIQGFAGGMAIPLGMSALMKVLPQSQWAKASASMNMVTLIAPALGPIFGAYITIQFGWSWIFLIKLPLSLVCLALTLYWIKKDHGEIKTPFDWKGFVLGGSSLTLILWAFSEVGKSHPILLAMAFILATLLGFFFFEIEKRTPFPLIPLSIFKIKTFAFGNAIQCSANTIFLGASFLIALYLQKGLGHDLVTTGWIMASITPGMLLAQPIIGKFYNRLGPIPFIIPGLIGLSLSMIAFSITTPLTSPYILALIVFTIGLSSATAQTANVPSIFSEVPNQIKSSGSSLYSLFKQISASFGVALSAMILSIHTHPESITAFHSCFIILGLIPAGSLIFCKFLSVKKGATNAAT